MASIKDTPGKLYFIKEQDHLTGEISSYVKIGLVRNEKDTAKRILEHQTGNPRRIFDHKTLESPFVEHLETLIHYVFADHWITGEWFQMDDAVLARAISRAEELIAEQSAYAERIRKAEELKSVLDDGSSRDATDTELELHEKYVSTKLELDRWDALLDVLGYRLKEICGNRMGIAGVCAYTSVKPSLVFNEREFAEQYPEVHQEFLKEETKPSQSFNVTGKISLKKEDPDLFARKSELSKADYPDPVLKEQLQLTDEVKQLHAQYLQAQSQVRVLEWEKDKLEIDLKYAVDQAEEIEGVCTWKRKEKTSTKFDKKALKESHPELYAQFEFEKANSPKFSVNAWRPYKH